MPQIDAIDLAPPPGARLKTARGKYCPQCFTVYVQDATEDVPRFCGKDGGGLKDAERILAGKYILGDRLGWGNMSDVYTAIQAGVGRLVALKVLRADLSQNAEAVKRFEREAQIASSLDHPNAITIFENGCTDEGHAYIAMELLSGETLDKMLRRAGPLPQKRALELMFPVVRAVAAAHKKGIVHRDLKPDNIFIAQKPVLAEGDGPHEVVKVLDFGIAKMLDHIGGGPGGGARLTSAHSAIGTPLYMSPEQIQADEATTRSDVFALGLILTQMLTGKLPWRETDESDSGQLMARLVSPPRSLSVLDPGGQFSPELQQLLDKLLARDPAARPQDAGAVLRLLQQLSESQSIPPAAKTTDATLAVQAMTPPPGSRPAWLKPPARVWLVAGGLLAATGLLWAGVRLMGGQPATPVRLAASPLPDKPSVKLDSKLDNKLDGKPVLAATPPREEPKGPPDVRPTEPPETPPEPRRKRRHGSKHRDTASLSPSTSKKRNDKDGKPAPFKLVKDNY